MTRLSFVTICKGRLSFLQRTLGRMAAQPGCSCVVVDYSCPEHAGDWVEANYPQVPVVRRPGQALFSRSSAMNAGAQAVDTPWICFIDADILIEPDFGQTVLPMLTPGFFYRADSQDLTLSGTMICQREEFARAGGYDEVIQGWGEEDNDLYETLEFAGLEPRQFPASLIHHLPHQDDVRVQFHTIRSKELSCTINRVYRFAKWDVVHLTGSILPLEQRQKIYQWVNQKVLAAMESGKESELEIQFTDFGIAGHWSLSRKLSYKFRSESGT